MSSTKCITNVLSETNRASLCKKSIVKILYIKSSKMPMSTKIDAFKQNDDEIIILELHIDTLLFLLLTYKS